MYNNNGLNNEEVKESRKKYGSNNISGKNTNTFFNLFIETLGDPIIKILIIALAVKTIFLFKDFDYFETIGIVIAILVASLISAISEYGSNKAFERMQEESSKINVRVRRNKKIIEISIDDIVKNDVIILSSGEKIPADGILIRGKLSVDESSLNGESKEVYKELTKDINIISDKNKVYRGTTIYDGTAEVLITKVGMDTLYGKMAKELTTGEDISPLKLRLTNLAKIISKIGYIAAILIAISYLFSKIFILNNFNLSIIKAIPLNTIIGYILEAMTLAVSVLVMAVPEGLPMMITLVLSTNSKKMLKNKVLVRKMVGIETAGSLNILFTDKTGTITNGKMEVISILDGSLKEYLQEQAEMLGIADSVVFAGKRTDTELYYQAMDVFVLPSLLEGFPIVLLEAQCSGLNCICSETITQKVCITNSIKRIPLSNSSKWIDEIEKAAESSDRNDNSKLLEAKGFDTNKQIKYIEQIYAGIE